LAVKRIRRESGHVEVPMAEACRNPFEASLRVAWQLR